MQLHHSNVSSEYLFALLGGVCFVLLCDRGDSLFTFFVSARTRPKLNLTKADSCYFVLKYLSSSNFIIQAWICTARGTIKKPLSVKAKSFPLLGTDGVKRLNEPSTSCCIVFHDLSASTSEKPEENLVRPFFSHCFFKGMWGNIEKYLLVDPLQRYSHGWQPVPSLFEGAVLLIGCILV